MENSSSFIICTECQTRLKRQILGSNIFYYCRNCGYLSSEANFSEKTIELDAQEPLSIQGTLCNESKLSKGDQITIVEA